MRMFLRLFAVSLLAWLTGCSNAVPTSSTSPTSPSPPDPLYVVSGILSEMVDGISRPVADAQVHLYISGTCGQSAPFGTVCRVERGRQPYMTDDHGRYTAPHVPKSWVFVSANVSGLQPCVASALVDKDTTIDVQVIPEGRPSTPPPAASPMITGLVYETTSQGRKPLRGVDVGLEVGYEGYGVARTQTDDTGRFLLCRVNAPAQMVNAPVLLYASSSGYQTAGPLSIPGTGDMSFEIELKR
jgi:hypothetical protein